MVKREIALFAVELCTELSIAEFRLIPVEVTPGRYVTLADLGSAGATVFALTKDAVIRQIARSARESYPQVAPPAWKSAAARLIVDAVTDVRDDDRLSVIAETATPDGEEGLRMSDRLHVPDQPDVFEALLPIMSRAAQELLDGFELYLASTAEKRR